MFPGVDNALPIEPIDMSGQYVNGFLHDVTGWLNCFVSSQVCGIDKL